MSGGSQAVHSGLGLDNVASPTVAIDDHVPSPVNLPFVKLNVEPTMAKSTEVRQS